MAWRRPTVAAPLSRRAALIGATALGASAWAHPGPGPQAWDERLGALTEPGDENAPAVAAAGLVVRRGGDVVFEGAVGVAGGLSPEERAAGAPLRPFTATTPMRVASVSKMAVALAVERAAADGAIDVEADVQAFWPGLRHPRHAAPITMAHLLAHTSSLRDGPTYWLNAPGRIEALVTAETFADPPPGAWFHYCNLNFGIAATLLERASGERFDRLAAAALAPHGIAGNFNWSGVPADQRARGATLYRPHDGAWRVATDGPEILRDDAPAALLEDGVALRDYALGSNGTIFSPQGGLRATLQEMARLARAVADAPMLRKPRWRWDPAAPNGDDSELFVMSGLGCFWWDAERSPIPGQRMVGHDGEAYGLYSGAWRLPDLDAEIAFAVTGAAEGPQPPSWHRGYNIWSQSLFDLAGAVLGVH